MSFGSFLSGIYHQVVPNFLGDRQTYGSVNPPRRKRPEDQPGYQAPQVQAPRPTQSVNQPQAQRPENLFQGLNKNLMIGGNKPNVIPVFHAPGITTIKPTPNTNKVYHDSQGNVIGWEDATGSHLTQAGTHQQNAALHPPEGLGTRLKRAANLTALSVGRVGTGFAQGLADLPAAAVNLYDRGANIVTRKPQTTHSSLAKTTNQIAGVINRPFDAINKRLDQAAAHYGGNAPQVYRKAQIGENVALAIPALVAGLAKVVPRAVSKFGGRVAEKGAGTITPPRVIPVRKNIPVRESTTIPITEAVSEATRVPVRTIGQPPGNIIREVGGDATKTTPNAVINRRVVEAQRNAAEIANNATPADRRIEGVKPGTPSRPFKLTPEAVATGQNKIIEDYATMLRGLGEGNGVDINKVTGTRGSNNFRPGMGTGRVTKGQWLDEAKRQLESGQAEPGTQKAFNDAADPEVQAMIAKGEPAPEGTPIVVKQATGIPVTDQSVVATNLPETPGKVRATTASAPSKAKSEAVANTPVAVAPVKLPAETQAILDNPKQFNKRQVAAARNQRKLAKQMAKTQEETAAVLDRVNASTPAGKTTPGFVSTGEFRKGANKNVSEVAHKSTEEAQAAADTATMSAGEVVKRAEQDISTNGVVSPESVRNLDAMLQSGRFTQTSPEYRAIAKTLYGAGSDYGRGLSLFNPTMRRTATGDQLANRFISKLYGVAEDGTKIADSDFAMVDSAANNFTNARDAANQALDRYNASKAPADFAAWKQARQVADDAEKHSLITEYRVANKVLKGNKNPEAVKAIQTAEKEAGVYQMDWVDASMLSGTGTFARNFVNTSLVRLENSLFGRIGGGYSSKGAKIGNKMGNVSVKSDFNARNELDQNKLSKLVKQWSTTGNTLGEGNIRAVGTARAYKYYEKQLKANGVTGDQLKRDTEVMLHTDPDGMAQAMQEWSLQENALASVSHNSKKLEQSMVEWLSGHGHGKVAQTTAKALVRLTVGFPTVIGRSLYGGAKRATLGIPEALIASGKRLAGGDPQAFKDALYTAKVHGGSGAALYALGTGLAAAGLISPSYPTDPAEQARWKAEGKQPNSIKIGGQWFGIPGFFGALALPLIIPANVMGKNSPKDVVEGVVSGLQDLAPTSGIINFIDGIEGRNGKQWVKNEISSLTRAFTPVGSLLNEIAKMTDSTKNDTTTKDGINNLVDAIAGGIPGVNNAVNKIPATDASGNVLHNPNPIGTFFGAQGAEQKAGVESVNQAQSAADKSYQQLKDYGILDNKDLMGLVDPKIQAQIARGEALTPEQVDSVRNAVVKGVTSTGEDTAYLERGQYDANLAVLNIKKDLLSEDPTVKPSSLKDLDTAIKRGEIYKDNQIPYDMVDSYKGTSLTEWRAMGDPQNDAYNPKMYQKLWDIDQKLTKAGVSYKYGDPKQAKYSIKKAGSGSGSGQRSIDTSFGTLKAGAFAPQIKQYDTIDTKAGVIPHISVARPNIVHKITSSG